jgi:type IV pilus assembly protein PilC
MESFAYVAKLADGRTVQGVLEADSRQEVLGKLHRQGLIVVDLKPVRAHRALKGRVRLDDLAIFCRQMATLVDAGVPVVSGLEAVAQQLENRTLREVILRVRNDVEAGTGLTAAIAKQSAVFSHLFVSMIKSGEVSGHLSEVLERLAVYLEKSAALQRKIRAALIYPAIVMTMATIITALLMLTVIPAFKEIFATLGTDLPLPTRILIAVSDFIRRWFFLGVVGLVVGIVMMRRWVLRTPKGRLWFDRHLIRLPIVGPLVHKVAIAKFARTLATLVRSGVQILAALEIVAETTGNRVVRDAVLAVKASIKEGENIANPLSQSGVFPPIVVRMVAVGEQTGRLDEMLSKVADFYEERVEVAVAGLTSAMEPIVIAILGVVVGSIVLAIFLPIFRMTAMLSGH